MQFRESDHIFRSEQFRPLINECISFIEATQEYRLTDVWNSEFDFYGSGVYEFFFLGEQPSFYNQIANDNKENLSHPIYVGKAVPPGWRQGRKIRNEHRSLRNRIREHAKNIRQARNLNLEDFYFKFVILEGELNDIISTVETALIRKSSPLWNSLIDGFGNHDPGKGRYEQERSEWDILHPGREWAQKLSSSKAQAEVISKVETWLEQK